MGSFHFYLHAKCIAIMMRILLLSVLVSQAAAFQFMKNWKMPAHDPHEAVVKNRFGDKSK